MKGSKEDEAKEVKNIIIDIIAALEVARLHEEDVYARLVSNNEEEAPHEIAVMGKEAGLEKAITIAKRKLGELENKA